MLEPEFKEDDIITFELMDDSNDETYETPRWDFNTDRGGSGKWAIGRVLHARDGEIHIEVTGRYQLWGWYWPMKGDSEYDISQWNRDGYLRHAKKYDTTLNEKAEITFNGSSV